MTIAGRVAAGIAALGLLVGCSGEAPVVEPAVADVVERPPLRVGVSLPSYHYDPSAVVAWEEEVDHRADVVQTFVPWRYRASPRLTAFPTDRARVISEGGRTLEVTWTPADPGDGEDRPGIALADVAEGEEDAYVRRFARDVAASGLTIRLRFAHEMNGDWSRWSEEHHGNSTGDYVAAWRYLHDVFAEEGATRVVWVWSPNVISGSTQPLEGLYPGDAYVDEVGLDGYSNPRVGCPGPGALFDATLAEVRRLSTRPVAIAEVGVDASCPDRAAWVEQFFSWSRDRRLVGFTWWERSGGDDDYRITTDPAVASAFRSSARG